MITENKKNNDKKDFSIKKKPFKIIFFFTEIFKKFCIKNFKAQDYVLKLIKKQYFL